MDRMKRVLARPLFTLLLGSALGLAAPAFAQQEGGYGQGQPGYGQPQPYGQPPSGQTGQPGQMPMGGQKRPDPMARVERQIRELRERLKITPQQEPQWNELVSVMRENAREMEQLFQERGAHFNQMNAVESLRSYQKIAEAHAAGMQKLVPVFEKLYDVLTPEQRRAADEAFRYQNMGHRRGGMGGNMGGGNMGGGMQQGQ
jgi:protein CpxP